MIRTIAYSLDDKKVYLKSQHVFHLGNIRMEDEMMLGFLRVMFQSIENHHTEQLIDLLVQGEALHKDLESR